MSWVIARFANNATVPTDVASPGDIAAAREALRCGEIVDLYRRPSAPLSFSTLFSNAVHAFTDYGVHIDRIPQRAAAKCN